MLQDHGSNRINSWSKLYLIIQWHVKNYLSSALTDGQLQVIIILVSPSYTHKSELTAMAFTCFQNGSDYCTDYKQTNINKIVWTHLTNYAGCLFPSYIKSCIISNQKGWSVHFNLTDLELLDPQSIRLYRDDGMLLIYAGEMTTKCLLGLNEVGYSHQESPLIASFCIWHAHLQCGHDTMVILPVATQTSVVIKATSLTFCYTGLLAAQCFSMIESLNAE